MALRLEISGQHLDVPAGHSIEINFFNPVFNKLGSQSVSVTLPATAHNLALLGHPERTDSLNRSLTFDGYVSDGPYRRLVRYNVISAGPSGIELNFGTDESLLYDQWSDTQLRDIPELPVINGEGETLQSKVNHLASILQNIYVRNDESSPFRVFPVALEFEDIPSEQSEKTATFTILNDVAFNFDEYDPQSAIIYNERTMTFGKDRDVNVDVPLGYGVSPFLRVCSFLHLLFDSYGFILEENVFDADPQLNQLVLLNNTMDTICNGYIDYKDLLPDCTINDFLDSLKSRFGAVFFINCSSRTARIKLLREIFSDSPVSDLTLRRSCEPTVTLANPQRLVLNTKNSYSFTDTSEADYKSFIERYTDWFEIPRNGIPGSPFFFHPFTREFHCYDRKQNLKLFLSSLHYQWNTQEADYDEYELSGCDESLGMFTILNRPFNPVPTDTYDPEHITTYQPNDYQSVACYALPLYLSGIKNSHTIIKNSTAVTTDDTLEENTDLCFCFAHGLIDAAYLPNFIQFYYGSPYCFDYRGNHFTDPDGNVYTYSLYPCGNDGSYNRFFYEYDKFLRHSNNSVEYDMSYTLPQINTADLSRPISINGQAMLFDKMSFQLPYTNFQSRSSVFRTLKPYNPDSITPVSIDNLPYPLTYWYISNDYDTIVNNAFNYMLSTLRDQYDYVEVLEFIATNLSYTDLPERPVPSLEQAQSHYQESRNYEIRVSMHYRYNDRTHGGMFDHQWGESYFDETYTCHEYLEATQRENVPPIP